MVHSGSVPVHERYVSACVGPELRRALELYARANDRSLKEFPPTPPARPIVPAFRVTKTFSRYGRTFTEGELLSLDSPIAQEIHQPFPEYLQPAR